MLAIDRPCAIDLITKSQIRARTAYIFEEFVQANISAALVSRQSSSEVPILRGWGEGETFTISNPSNCGRRLGVRAPKYMNSLERGLLV